MALSKQEISVLRELAQRYMEAASLPVQQEKIKLWKSLNRMEMQRPMVVIDQLPWNELNGEGELTCTVRDPVWREVETELRQTLYKWNHFPVDMVIDPFITVPKAVTVIRKGMEVEEQVLATDQTNSVVSHQYHNRLRSLEDVALIEDMQVLHDSEETERRRQEAEMLFCGIAPFRLSSKLQFNLGVWDVISTLMGVENVYYALMDDPDLLHAAADRLTESYLNGIRQADKQGLLDDNINTCHCSYIYTDELLPDSGEGKGPYAKNCWAFGLAQLFSSVSPQVTEEYELPCITKMAQPFGMIYYGCCDRLDDRLELVKKIPHVKKVSCSPWSEREAFAERIGKGLVMSNKPNPALVASNPADFDEVKKDLRRTCDAAKANGVNLELILKDISTVNYQPQRLTEWAEIAMRIVQNY